MKLFNIVFCLTFVFAATAFANDEFLELGAQAYSQRSTEAQGIANVERAVELYTKALPSAANSSQRESALIGLAQAQYYLGTVYSDEDQKMQNFLASIQSAEAVAAEMGVEKTHELSGATIAELQATKSPEDLESLAKSMYFKAISLAQWGKLKGIATSIARIGEVTGNMETIKALGFEHIFQYGPDRTIGRVKFTLPKLFGGDLKLSEKLLKNVYKNSLATGADGETLKYSINGYTNIYLAETLYKRKKEKQAQQILALFVAADPGTLEPTLVPENKEALVRAQELMQDWQ